MSFIIVGKENHTDLLVEFAVRGCPAQRPGLSGRPVARRAILARGLRYRRWRGRGWSACVFAPHSFFGERLFWNRIACRGLFRRIARGGVCAAGDW